MDNNKLLNDIASKCTEDELSALQDLLSVKTAAAEVPWHEDEAFLAKLAAEHTAEEIDTMFQEAAKEEELAKIAADYDSAGRLMARGYFDEMVKLCRSAGLVPNQETDKVALLKKYLK